MENVGPVIQELEILNLDLPKILQSARRSNVQRYYIEDESPDCAAQVPRSLAYLASLQVEVEPLETTDPASAAP